MQCFMYHEADSYGGNIFYITKILLIYAHSSWEDKAEEKNLDERCGLIFKGVLKVHNG